MRKSASGDENSPYFRYNGKLSADLRRKAYMYRHRYPPDQKNVKQLGLHARLCQAELEKHAARKRPVARRNPLIIRSNDSAAVSYTANTAMHV